MVRIKSFFRIIAVWLMLAVMVWLRIPAPDVSASSSGSIEMIFPADAAGVGMTLYPVAVYTEDQSFQYQGVFEGCEIRIMDLESAEQMQQAAEQLAALAKEKGAEGVKKTIGGDGVLRYTELVPAYYLLVQSDSEDRIDVQKTLVPLPYTAEDGALTYDAVVAPKYSVPEGAVILHKVDDDKNAVGQVHFKLQRKVYVSDGGELPSGAETGQDGDGRFFWEDYKDDLVTDEYGQIALKNLPLGIYRFLELKTLEGFILNEAPGYFSVDESGEIKELGGIYEASSGQVEEVTIVNTQTSLVVNKVDEAGKAVSGAKLVLKDADGNVILGDDGTAKYVFITADEAYEIKRLAAGEYYLSEIVSPEGYRVAADVKLTVSDEADAVNTVTMVDETVTETNVSLKVTKRLVDSSGLALDAEEQDFYVALFEDEERTSRISDVMTLHFSKSGSTSVTFDNLEKGKTYYVGETDEYGVLLVSASLDDAVYAPEYPDGYEVKITAASQQKEMTFENVFYDLPHNFYYGGELTVTKKVLKDGSPYDSENVFYAAVFHDAACTDRYSDVLELSMEGGSETSVTIPVYIGEDADGSVKYYVAETDEDGNVLDPDSGLEFTISVDKAEIEMTPQNSSAEVVITNEFSEEETEPDTEGPTEPDTEAPTEPDTEGPTEPDTEAPTETDQSESPGGPDNPKKPDTPEKPGGSGSSTVRTGDNTPLTLYLVLLVISAAVVCGVIVVVVKKKRKR